MCVKMFLVLFTLVHASSPVPWDTQIDNSLNQDLDLKFIVKKTKNKINKTGYLRQFSENDFIDDGLLEEVELLDEAVPKVEFSEITPFDFEITNETKASANATKVNATHLLEQGNGTIGNKSARNERQNDLDGNGVNNEDEELDVTNPVSTTTEVSANQEDGLQESEESEEEERDIVQSLISTFLSGLSTPEGGVDIDAIVGLIGGLSVLRDDGTYDFSGLTETLQSFLGGTDGGGSDVGSFLGGLLGAVIQGVAKPPGAKGAGILSGKLIKSILPGLSAPPQADEGAETKPKPQLDSGGFLAGILKGVLGINGGGNDKNQWNKPIISIKQKLFKAIFSLISSVLTSSSKTW